MLVREVYAWLKYCLTRDPVCMANGIAVEEIDSPFVVFDDKSEGVRTIAIYKACLGLTPRIEIRFLPNSPQVWSIKHEGNPTLITTPYSNHFGSNLRSWTRSDFVSYLLDLAKSELCNDTHAKILLIKAEALPSEKIVGDVDKYADYKKLDTKYGREKIPLWSVKVILKALETASKKGNKLTQDKVNDWLKTNTTGNIDDFAKYVMKYFDAGAIEWKDIDLLEDEFPPGSPIIHWRRLQKELSEPKRLSKLPPDIADRVLGKTGAKAVRRAMDSMIAAFNAGNCVTTGIDLSYPAIFGEDVETVLAQGQIPLPYLEIAEKCDPKELVAPWSLIRRSIIAYKIPKTSEKVSDCILEWLEKSKLITALYNLEESPEAKSIIKKRIENYEAKTTGNSNWVSAVLDATLINANTLETRRSLQGEFDMWLLQVISPSVSASKLPLSPHAYMAGKAQEDLYHKAFASWINTIKETSASRKNQSVKNLSESLSHFYETAVTKWKPDMAEDYTPKIPSITKITIAAKSSNKEDLLSLLLTDLENEVGMSTPKEIKSELVNNPYFNTIYKEVRFQSVRL